MFSIFGNIKRSLIQIIICSFIVGVLYIIVIYLITTLYIKTLYNHLVGVEPTYALRYFCLAKQFHNHLGIQLPKQLQVVI